MALPGNFIIVDYVAGLYLIFLINTGFCTDVNKLIAQSWLCWQISHFCASVLYEKQHHTEKANCDDDDVCVFVCVCVSYCSFNPGLRFTSITKDWNYL